MFKTIFSNKNTLASQPTIPCFFKAITQETISHFMHVVQNNIQDKVINLDSTHSATYGNQECASFNNHYQTIVYPPPPFYV
ncbi:transposase [Enterococcus italicus]|uniref:transposase n=1 Tax=Enterococcus italicus TaxID=246144 RepID=UPI0035E4245B